EGHIWNFGTYNRWTRQAAYASQAGRSALRSGTATRGLRRSVVAAGLLVTVAASAIVALAVGAPVRLNLQFVSLAATAEPADAAPRTEREQAGALTGREAAERAVQDIREQLA